MKDLTPTPESLDPIEIASRDEITALQLDRLRWSLRHAYEGSAFYRRRFDEAGVHPDDLESLSDLAKFPFTTKADLRDTYPFGMFAVPREQLCRIHASSGTTGKPTIVGYTKTDMTSGPISWPARSAHPAAVRETSVTLPTATACSPAGSARITARNGSAAPSSPFRAA